MLKDEAFNIAKNPKYDGYERGIASQFFDQKSASHSDKSISGSCVANNEI